MSTCSSTPKSFQSPMNFMVRAFVCLLVLATIASTGCSTFRLLDEQAALTYRDFVWAKRAYNLRYGRCDRPYAEHFQNGFCAGYADICGGGDGYVPALPPDSYRSYEFQSSDGSKCVNAWFEGYPAGVAAAKQDKSGAYHNIMISRMIDRAVKQEKTDASLPNDVSVVDAQAKRSDTAVTIQPTNQPRPIRPVNPMPSVLKPIEDSAPKPMVLPPVVPARFDGPSDFGQTAPPVIGWRR